MYELNDFLPAKLLSSSDKMLLVSSGQFLKYINYEYNNINFEIAYDDERKVKFISTTDPNFSSVDGLNINSKLSEIGDIDLSIIKYESGWAYIILLVDGWNAGISPENYDNPSVNKNSKISFFFKR